MSTSTLTNPVSRRFTKEEINARLDQAERDFANGLGIPDEDVWDELEGAQCACPSVMVPP